MMHGAVAILALLVHVSVRAAPVSTPPPEKPPPDAALKFMKRFGYLEPGTPDSEALYSGEAIVEAIKTVQKFGALPQTGLLDNATLDLMQAKRCGVPDIARHKQERRKRYVVGSEGWSKREITYFIANWSPKIGEETVVQDMRRAFDAWSGYSGLKFRHVMEPNADIIVAFGRGPHGDGYPFDGPGNILAHAFYPYEMGNYGGDIHFDDDEHWMDKPGEFDDGVDFFSVAVHELGHSLGLAHSPVSTSVMFPYYKPYISTFQLDYDDILAMWNLYINRKLEENETSPSSSDDNNGADDGSQDDDTTREDPDRNDDHDDDDDDDDDERRKHVDSEDTSTEKDTTKNRSTPTPPTRDYNVTYYGDEESVEDHMDHDDKHGIPKSPSVPDACDGYYDAVATLRGEMFIFKEKYVWRLSHRGLVQQGYPVPFRQMFWKLPENITVIDAAYQRETDGNIILFSGKYFWVYDGDSFIEGSPKPLTDYGLPGFLQKIDAAMVWNKNGKTFLFSGDRYWRYNETTRQMDPGYPHNINRWRGVPPNLDAAVTWKDGLTYFFKGKLFWRFDNLMIKTDDHYPLPAPQNWLGCPEKPDTVWW